MKPYFKMLSVPLSTKIADTLTTILFASSLQKAAAIAAIIAAVFVAIAPTFAARSIQVPLCGFRGQSSAWQSALERTFFIQRGTLAPPFDRYEEGSVAWKTLGQDVENVGCNTTAIMFSLANALRALDAGHTCIRLGKQSGALDFTTATC
jgi:hypothetical protein